MPSKFLIFMRNGENKSNLLNLIEQVYVEDNTKLQNRGIYFSNKIHFQKISADAQYCDRIFSDHEETDTNW